MSTFEIPSYAPLNNLPAPTTSATTVSAIDINGDTWVAKSTVNSGNWAKARDVLNCQWFRTGALSFPGAYTTLPWDTSVFDSYGLYSTGTSRFTLPIAGVWRFTQTLNASCYANGYLSSAINVISGGVAGEGATYPAAMANGGTVQNVSATVSVSLKLTAGAQVQSYSAASGSLAMTVPGLGIVFNFISVDYVGTG